MNDFLRETVLRFLESRKEKKTSKLKTVYLFNLWTFPLLVIVLITSSLSLFHADFGSLKQFLYGDQSKEIIFVLGEECPKGTEVFQEAQNRVILVDNMESSTLYNMIIGGNNVHSHQSISKTEELDESDQDQKPFVKTEVSRNNDLIDWQGGGVLDDKLSTVNHHHKIHLPYGASLPSYIKVKACLRSI